MKKLIVLIVLALLFISVVGCTDSDDNGDKDTTNGDSDTNGDNDDDNGNGDDEPTTGDYETVTVSDLMDNRYTYKDQSVKLEDVYVTDYRSPQSFNVSDSETDTTSVWIWYQGNTDEIGEGAKLTITGLFESTTYDHKWQVSVQDSVSDDKVTIIEAGEVETQEYMDTTVSDLITDPETYEDEFVRVTGEVTDANSYDKGYGEDPTSWVKFNVTDPADSSVGILLIYGQAGGADRPTSLASGDEVMIQGEYTYYDTDDVWEIYVRANSDDKIEKV